MSGPWSHPLPALRRSIGPYKWSDRNVRGLEYRTRRGNRHGPRASFGSAFPGSKVSSPAQIQSSPHLRIRQWLVRTRSALGRGCVKTSNRNGNEQLCGSETVRPEIFRVVTEPFLTYRCAATDRKRVFPQPRSSAAVGNARERMSACSRYALHSGRSGFGQLRSNSASLLCTHSRHLAELGSVSESDVRARRRWVWMADIRSTVLAHGSRLNSALNPGLADSS